jgi:hypothetical protein
VKVDCEHIEGIEADLMDCPSLFGTGDPNDAVEKVNVLLDEAERIDAQVGYRVVLRICDVLSKRHQLFGNLHTEKLKPSAVTERRNARPEMFILMNDVTKILINIGENAQHWKVNNVDIRIGIKTYHCEVIQDRRHEPRREQHRGMAEMEQQVNQVERQQGNDNGGKRKAEDGGKPTCVYDGCTRPAFSHKRERGGHLHGSKMCFDHFLLGVEDSKLSKPVGIPIKGGKTMIAKRGEDKSWEYKIFNIRLRIHEGLNLLRSNTFLKNIANKDAEDLLGALHEEFERGGDNKMEVYHTEMVDGGGGFAWNTIMEESSGSFMLPGRDSLVPIYDVKRQRTGQDFSQHQNLYLDERASRKE